MQPRGGEVEEPEKFTYLREVHADELHHSDRTLFDHLAATADLLARWGARPPVCDAGLYHSVYGTESLRHVTIDPSRRESVQQRIGAEAERLAMLFCAMERQRFVAGAGAGTPDAVHHHVSGEAMPVTPAEVAGLANILAANSVEQLPRLPRRARVAVPRLLAMRAHLLDEAIVGLEGLLPAGAARSAG